MPFSEREKNIAKAISAQSITDNLKNDVKVVFFENIDSTNSEAKRNAHLLTTKPILFVANQQSGGRGRLGRSFYSPKDTGLYMSLLLKAQEDFEDNICITTATAVYVTKAIKELSDADPKIKWVNDIYIGLKKVCGILCEAVTDPVTSKISGIIIGIGINITTDVFPDDIKRIASSLNQNIDRSLLCAKITDNILDGIKNIGDRSFIEEYKAHSLVLNKEITFLENGDTHTATAIDIDKNGGLIIGTESGLRTLSTGEITVRLKND